MDSCLGIYVEPNIIKYAKISKNHDNLTVDSFGIKFYDKIGDAIKQVVSDTYSYRTPISINLSEESYQYFYMFSLLNKTDLKKAIQTEFESYCSEKGLNKNTEETRYILVNDLDNKDKVKVVNISAKKNVINTLQHHFSDFNVSTVSPIGIGICNIANLEPKENILIINMEEITTLTFVTDKKVYAVEKLEEGSRTVLDSIAAKENSYSKAYEICKNSTIYTMESNDLQEGENVYLDDIMPTLYKIANKTKEIIEKETFKIDKIFLTGTLSVVNNIDLYFQEFFKTEKCEILKPFFIKDSVKINIKDYIEANSAIALATQGLGYGIKSINFKNRTLKDDVNDLLAKFQKNDDNNKGQKKSIKINFDLKGNLDKVELSLCRLAGGILLLTIIYSGFSVFLNNGIEAKMTEIAEVKADTTKQIQAISADIDKANAKTEQYIELKQNLEDARSELEANNKNKKIIPNFLSQVRASIPRGVQLLSINNPSGKHIVIEAQSQRYEQLGYFKVVLKTQGILNPDTVISNDGEKQGDLIKIKIEGDLP